MQRSSGSGGAIEPSTSRGGSENDDGRSLGLVCSPNLGERPAFHCQYFDAPSAWGRWVAGPRDTPQEVSGISGRFVRAHRNLLEIFPQFAAALFLVHAAGAVGTLSTVGAWLFVAARTFYVPAYAFAPSGVRPFFWLAAWLGIALIVMDLFV